MAIAKKATLAEIDLALRRMNPKNRKPYHCSANCTADGNGDQGLQKLGEQLIPLVANLDDRRRMVVTLRYGLNGETPKTLQAIGLKLKRTRERIRQLQETALAQLHESQ